MNGNVGFYVMSGVMFFIIYVVLKLIYKFIVW